MAKPKDVRYNYLISIVNRAQRSLFDFICSEVSLEALDTHKSKCIVFMQTPYLKSDSAALGQEQA